MRSSVTQLVHDGKPFIIHIMDLYSSSFSPFLERANTLVSRCPAVKVQVIEFPATSPQGCKNDRVTVKKFRGSCRIWNAKRCCESSSEASGGAGSFRIAVFISCLVRGFFIVSF